MSDQGIAERAASTLVRESGAVLILALLAAPGFLALRLVAADLTGFYLIAFTGAAGHVTLRRMSERDRSIETDLSGANATQAALFLFVLVGVGVVAVSSRLVLGVVAGELITTAVGRSLIAVVGAAVTPVGDYLLGKYSPTRQLVVVSIWLLAGLAEWRDPDAAESIRRDAPRVDPM